MSYWATELNDLVDSSPLLRLVCACDPTKRFGRADLWGGVLLAFARQEALPGGIEARA